MTWYTLLYKGISKCVSATVHNQRVTATFTNKPRTHQHIMVLEFNPNHIDSIIDSMAEPMLLNSEHIYNGASYNGASYIQFKLPIASVGFHTHAVYLWYGPW